MVAEVTHIYNRDVTLNEHTDRQGKFVWRDAGIGGTFRIQTEERRKDRYK